MPSFVIQSLFQSGRDVALELSTGETASLCHGSILLLKPIAQALRALHVLIYASHDTALFSGGERLAFEAVDAVVETALDKIRVHLMSDPLAPRTEVALRHGVHSAVGDGHTFINSFICFFSMRVCSSRCSAEERLLCD